MFSIFSSGLKRLQAENKQLKSQLAELDRKYDNANRALEGAYTLTAQLVQEHCESKQGDKAVGTIEGILKIAQLPSEDLLGLIRTITDQHLAKSYCPVCDLGYKACICQLKELSTETDSTDELQNTLHVANKEVQKEKERRNESM